VRSESSSFSIALMAWSAGGFDITVRARVLAVLNRRKPDLVPWLGDLDYWIAALDDQGLLAEEYRGSGLYRLHRHLGVGFYLQGYWPFLPDYDGVQVEEETHGGVRISRIRTAVGEVQQVERHLPESYCWGIQEHYVKDWRDLKVIRYWYEHTSYQPDYTLAKQRYEWVGDNGLVLCYLPRSPLMEMVVGIAGIEAVTYAIVDAPDEFDETLAVLEHKSDEAAEIALHSPAECLMIPENLSSELVGKHLFTKYMRDYEERWNRKIKNAGKYSFVHMDGTLEGLIREVASTGFSVLESLTPAPVGDLSIDELASRVGEGTTLWGGIPGAYFSDSVSDREFDRFVIHVLKIMRSEPRYVLGVADQVPPGTRWERIKRVGQLVEQYGSYDL
jgi:hypothetical protein